MSNDNDNAEGLELQKVLAASLAYTQKEFRRAKRELIEEFKEVLDPETGQSIKILEIKGARGPKGERGERGETGPQGARGEIGPSGIDGKMGVQGLMGPQGEKGDPGERGPQGERGLQGDSAEIAPLEDDIKRIKETLKNVGQQSASTAQKVNSIGWGEYQGGGGGGKESFGENIGSGTVQVFKQMRQDGETAFMQFRSIDVTRLFSISQASGVITLTQNSSILDLDADNNILHEEDFYSIGGGFILNSEEIKNEVEIKNVQTPFPFHTWEELFIHCERTGMTCRELMWINEQTWRTESEIWDGLLNIWGVMQ